MLHGLALALLYLFPVSELLLALRRRAGADASAQDRGSLRLLWATLGGSILAAWPLAYQGLAPLHLHGTAQDALVALSMGGGLLLRWSAILTLGRFFTVNVAIHRNHQVVEAGPYAYVRHPSYTGLLLLLLGVGLRFGDGLSLAVVLLPSALALGIRIRREEAALRAALGQPYLDYCARTKRLVPGLI